MDWSQKCTKLKAEKERLLTELAKRKARLEAMDVPIKVPRISLPADYHIDHQNLFSLPPEIVKPILASAHPGYKKKLAEQKKKESALKKQLRSYTDLRKNREEFRKKLIGTIINREDAVDVDNHEIPNADEREILRYYYYIRNGVDTIHVAPIDQHVLNRVLQLLPIKLKRWRKELLQCVEDMKEDYMMAIKKAIVDFVLRDPSFVETIVAEFDSPERQEVQTLKSSWQPAFDFGSAKMEKTLNIINPCIHALLDMWYSKFSNMRLFNLKALSEHAGAYELIDFQVELSTQIDDCKAYLIEQYYKSVVDIFLLGNKRNKLPNPAFPVRMKRFYNTVATIMTDQIQTLCMNSLNDYYNYMTNIKELNRGFEIGLIQKINILAFEPPFKNFRDVIFKGMDAIIASVKNVPRLETQLYLDYQFPVTYLQPIILESEIEALRTGLKELLEDQRIGPELRVQDFDDYMPLVNGEAIEEVTKFLAAEHTFAEYQELICYYKDVQEEVPIKMEHMVKVGMYDVHRIDLIEALVTSAEAIKEMLVKRCTLDYQTLCKNLGDEYQFISDKAMQMPESTAELIALIAYVNNVEAVVLTQMEDRLRDVLKYMLFLSDHTMFTPVEMKQNNHTFWWYLKMLRVIDEHREMIDVKMVEFQDSLNARIAKFQDDLDIYAKMVDDLQFNGNIEDLPKYHKKATQLDNRLIVAMERIDSFNEEEAAFKFELSQYPLRKQVHERLQPYKKLYDNATEFLEKRDLWMNSQVGSHEPETIETDVGQFYRTIYKLEKQFADKPVAQGLAINVREQIDEFKEYMPIINTLGNPGMKARHWEKISEIVGFPIRVEADLTLAKIIDYGLEEYIPKFDAISEAATKENNLERALSKMTNEWIDQEFQILVYRDTGTYIMSAVDEIQVLLDDHIVKTQTMKNSPYIKPFEAEIIVWEGKLQLLQDIMDDWLKVQATWMYLEPIFSSPDIQQQMPEEGRRFTAVDKIWRDIMKSVYADVRVLAVCDIDKMSERLKKCNNLLDMIQKGLNDYLEKKRLYFPRFFFLSNDELLEILSETKDPTRVQPHLKKCFEGMAKLQFTDDLDITKMKSSEGEEVPLVDVISTALARGQVEKWLVELEVDMKKSVHFHVTLAIEAYPSSLREEWVLVWPGQIVQCIAMLYWTSEVHEAITKSVTEMSNYLKTCNVQISKIVDLVRGKLNLQNRITLGAVVVLDVHARDVLSELIGLNVHSTNDFQWLSQIRYYWEVSELSDQIIAF